MLRSATARPQPSGHNPQYREWYQTGNLDHKCEPSGRRVDIKFSDSRDRSTAGIMIRCGSRFEQPNRIGVHPALSCADYAAGLSAGCGDRCGEVCGTSPSTAALSLADGGELVASEESFLCSTEAPKLAARAVREKLRRADFPSRCPGNERRALGPDVQLDLINPYR